MVVLSLASTAASLIVPLLSRDLIDDALLAGDRTVLVRIVALFIGLTLLGFLLNVASGLRYTRVSAEILFDMRLDLYRHLQRLSPRFYARTRLGDIVSRLKQRHRRDSSAWRPRPRSRGSATCCSWLGRSA